MPNKMLIDASHPEETRVVVTRGNRIEEFDFESQDKKQLRGNIYLARVTRVEPSLQAAFVEYGGNRHGFLAFNEIHPDYYQIPVADRQALLRAEAEAAQAEEDEEAEADERPSRERGRRRKRGGKGHARGERAAAEAAETGEDQDTAAAAEGETGSAPEAGDGGSGAAAEAESETGNAGANEPGDADAGDAQHSGGPNVIAAAVAADVVSEPVPDASEDPASEEKAGKVEEVNGSNGEDAEVESVGAEDALEEVHTRRRPLRRQYKIQEVIKRRQILLVQVVKEERGNKGAALTTYLSLAGRYSVLMPNTARGGGISRKITNAQDRKRLKDVVKDLDVPQGMGVILRTAGENRTKAEIKRDYEYLMRLWENVRNLTLQSTAPALVYEEGSLIKRSVRDLYNKDIDEILVSGEDGYREAKDFMRMLMPSHAKVVQPYRDAVPIFARNGIEAQLDRMLQPQVTLKSGGYIIINQTEALVAIDVNSGRSTREHSIEDTALQTNLEAAEEVARQLRLRDLAGLIVIDFIDMEENRNNRAVEKKLKDCLKNDRARIQVGRISHFGLMEMSRQRIRASVLESTMKPCPHCGGTGHVRSDSSVALHVIRAIEEYLLKDSRNHISVRTPSSTALYVLNHKRSNLIDLENRFGLTITIEADETLGAQHYAIVKGAPAERRAPALPDGAPLDTPAFEAMEAEEEVDEVEESQDRDARQPHGAEDGESHRDRRRKRRRRRRGGRDGAIAASGNDHAMAERPETSADEAETALEDAEAGHAEPAETTGEAAGGEQERKKRRRGKRGGKRNRHGSDHVAEEAGGENLSADPSTETTDAPEPADAVAAETLPEPQEAAYPAADEPAAAAEPVKAPRRRSRKSNAEPAAANGAGEAPAEAEAAAPGEAVANGGDAAPAETHAEPAQAEVEETQAEADETAAEPEPQPVPVVTSSGQPAGDEQRPRKSGWWQRKGFF